MTSLPRERKFPGCGAAVRKQRDTGNKRRGEFGGWKRFPVAHYPEAIGKPTVDAATLTYVLDP
jgi:hypothetical protein